MIKASTGSGGVRMRIVHDSIHIDEEIKRAMSEAKNAFGNNQIFIEKFIQSPKYTEFQIVGDLNGNYSTLFERDCSIQRRNQKVIEKVPCTFFLLENEKNSEFSH